MGYEVVGAVVEQEVSRFDGAFGDVDFPRAEIGDVEAAVEGEGAEACFHRVGGDVCPRWGASGDRVSKTGAGEGLLGEVHAELPPKAFHGFGYVGGGDLGDKAFYKGDRGDFVGGEREFGHGPLRWGESPGSGFLIELKGRAEVVSQRGDGSSGALYGVAELFSEV